MGIKKKIVVIFLLIGVRGLSQSPKLSWPEFGWVLGHPIAAIKVKVITKRCTAHLKQSSHPPLDAYNNGGKQDAFRHVFFMAAYAQQIKTKKVRKLGRAHEKANYLFFRRSKTENGEMADSLGSVMDLQNNELGLNMGCTNKKLDLLHLQKLVSTEINAGNAVIMKRDGVGNYLDREGKKIDLSLYKKVWGVPKCLVPSNTSNE